MKTQEIIETYNKRIDDLLSKLSGSLRSVSIVEGSYIGTLNIIESLYGSNSTQYKAIIESKNKFDTNAPYQLNNLGLYINGVLENIKEELNEGLIRNIVKETTGEVIGDFVSLAKAELKDGQIQVAAVLSSAALEDIMKIKAKEIDPNMQDNSLEDVINFLKSKSFFKGAQVPVVSSYETF